jgi:hypothetical protein
MENKEIYKIIDDPRNVYKMSLELINVFMKEANEKNVDYSFTVNQATGQIKNKEANTYFWFDPKPDTFLAKFKKALFAEDLNEIEQNSPDERELMERVRVFMIAVCIHMTSHYYSKIAETIRRVVLGNKKNNEQIPLDTIRVVTIDVADYSSIPEESKYLLEIGKITDTEIDTDRVTMFLQEQKEQTGMDYGDLLLLEKKIGNPLFKNVLSIKRGSKYLNEFSIYFFVDYSLEK